VRKPFGKRSLGLPIKKWKDDIKVNLRKVCCEDWRYTGLDQDPMMLSVEPSGCATVVINST